MIPKTRTLSFSSIGYAMYPDIVQISNETDRVRMFFMWPIEWPGDYIEDSKQYGPFMFVINNAAGAAGYLGDNI